jgi:hypothetical protein
MSNKERCICRMKFLQETNSYTELRRWKGMLDIFLVLLEFATSQLYCERFDLSKGFFSMECFYQMSCFQFAKNCGYMFK